MSEASAARRVFPKEHEGHEPKHFEELFDINIMEPQSQEELMEKLNLNTAVGLNEASNSAYRIGKRAGWARKIFVWETDEENKNLQEIKARQSGNGCKLPSLLSTTLHECEEWMALVGEANVTSLGKLLETMENVGKGRDRFQCTEVKGIATADEAYFQLQTIPQVGEMSLKFKGSGEPDWCAKIRGVMEELRMPSRRYDRGLWEAMKRGFREVFEDGTVTTEEDLWNAKTLKTIAKDYAIEWYPKYLIECRDKAGRWDEAALDGRLKQVREDIGAMMKQIVFRRILHEEAAKEFREVYDIQQKLWLQPRSAEVQDGVKDLRRDDLEETSHSLANKTLFDFGNRVMSQCKILELKYCQAEQDIDGTVRFMKDLVMSLPTAPEILEGSAAEFSSDYQPHVINYLRKFEKVMTQRASLGSKKPQAIFRSQELPSFSSRGKGLTLHYTCNESFEVLCNVRRSMQSLDSEDEDDYSSGESAAQQALVISSFKAGRGESAAVVREMGLRTVGLYTVSDDGKHTLTYTPLSQQAKGDDDAISLMEALDKYETLEIKVKDPSGDKSKDCTFHVTLNFEEWDAKEGFQDCTEIRCSHRECSVLKTGVPFRRFALLVQGAAAEQEEFTSGLKDFCKNNTAFSGSAVAVRDMLCFCAVRHPDDTELDFDTLVEKTDANTASRLIYCANRDTQERLPQAKKEDFKKLLNDHWRKVLSSEFKSDQETPPVPMALLALIRGGNSDPSVLLVDSHARQDLQGYVKKTRLESALIDVEPSNLEAVRNRIVQTRSEGCLCIFFLTLGQALSPADVCGIACASFSGSVRLIVSKTQSTVAALHEHRANGNVQVVESRFQSDSSREPPKSYDEYTTVGSAIIHVSKQLHEESQGKQLRADSHSQHLGSVKSRLPDEVRSHLLRHQQPHVTSLHNSTTGQKTPEWWRVEKHFRTETGKGVDLSVTGAIDNNVLLLVAEDPCLVEYYYNDLVNRQQVEPPLQALDPEFDKKFAKFQLRSSTSCSRAAARDEEEHVKLCCVVVYRSQMLSHERKKVIVQRAQTANMLLIFVVPNLDTVDLFELRNVRADQYSEGDASEQSAANYVYAHVHFSWHLCRRFIKEQVFSITDSSPPTSPSSDTESVVERDGHIRTPRGLCEVLFRSIRLAFGSVLSLEFLKSPGLISQLQKVTQCHDPDDRESIYAAIAGDVQKQLVRIG
eukprot:COSAG01_NODE_5574_length_4173_cov_107.019391_1_plen_1195_part_10